MKVMSSAYSSFFISQLELINSILHTTNSSEGHSLTGNMSSGVLQGSVLGSKISNTSLSGLEVCIKSSLLMHVC